MAAETGLADKGAATRPSPDPRFSLPRTLVFGIGAQKSGTTWLGTYFSGHPDVHMSLKKEIHYWNVVRPPHDSFPEGIREKNRKRAERLRSEGPLAQRLIRRVRERQKIAALKRHAEVTRDDAAPYASYADMLMLGYDRQPVVVEITPAYARLQPDTYREMSALGADVRFLFLMRDPLARLISGIRHHQRMHDGAKNVTTRSIENQLRNILRQRSHPIMERSRYDLTITRLEGAVDPARIFYGFFETIFEQGEIDRLCDFLSIRHHAAETDRKVFVASDRTGLPNPDLLKEAAKALRPVYDFTAARFGDVPDAWQNARGM